MLNLNAMVVRQSLEIWYQLVGNVIRRKVVDTGGTG